MDSHHEQVMKARESAQGGTRLYFGYSTVLDAEAFKTWRDQHGYDFFSLPEGKLGEALDTALVFDFPSRFWGGRVAGLATRPGATVWGRVYEISAKDWPIVQHKEGAVTGMSVELLVQVRVGDQTVSATAFATNPARVSSDGPKSAQFVEALLRGARTAALPEPWLATLESVAREP